MEPCYDASLPSASNVAAAMQILSSAVTQLAIFKFGRSCDRRRARWLITLISITALWAFVVHQFWPGAVTPGEERAMGAMDSVQRITDGIDALDG